MTVVRSAGAIIGAIVVIALLAMGSSLEPTAVVAAPLPAATLTVAMPSFLVEDVVPYLISGATMLYAGPLYDFLVGVDADGHLSPKTGIASAWASSEGGRVWSFLIRKGVKFHDGSDLTADDVAFTINLLASKDAKTSNSSVFQNGLVSAQAVSPTRVVVRMKDPAVELPALLSATAGDGAIIPKNYFQKVGLDGFRQHPVGSGPWKFVSRTIGSDIQFEANAAYWQGAPAFQHLTFRLVPEASTRLAMIRAGEADIVDAPRDSLATAKAAGLRIVSVRSVQTLGVQMYRSDDPSVIFSQKLVREALSLAIDRQTMLSKLFAGSGQVTGSYVFTPPMLGFDPGLKPYPYSQERAQALLRQAVGSATPKLTLWSYGLPGLAEATRAAEAVAGYWNDIGVTTNIVPIDFGAFRAKYLATPQQFGAPGDASLFVSYTYPSSLASVRIYMASGAAGGILRLGGPDSANIDALYQRASAEPNERLRGGLLRQINQVGYDDYLTIPLIALGQDYAVGSRVASWTPVPGSAWNLEFNLATPKR